LLAIETSERLRTWDDDASWLPALSLKIDGIAFADFSMPATASQLRGFSGFLVYNANDLFTIIVREES